MAVDCTPDSDNKMKKHHCQTYFSFHHTMYDSLLPPIRVSVGRCPVTFTDTKLGCAGLSGLATLTAFCGSVLVLRSQSGLTDLGLDLALLVKAFLVSD